jgi:hypothetical protein
VKKELVIVNDAGDKFSATDLPIPFYIRLKLDNEKTKYLARILDEAGNTRSFYTGVTKKDFLELHVPSTPLRKNGKIIIEIEVTDMNSDETIKHQATIDYVSQEEYDSITRSEIIEEVEERTEYINVDTHQPTEVRELVNKPTESYELTIDELAYLTQRAEILNETKDEEKEIVSEQIFSIDPDEEE